MQNNAADTQSSNDGDDDGDDLKLVQASAGLLADLGRHLPKILWKAPLSASTQTPRVHKQVKQRDLDRLVALIEPFQSEPQLLDAKLKTILPPIVDAYLQYISTSSHKHIESHVDLQSAVCILLYTLCKVRGHKVVVGFFNNEPRHLVPILRVLEATLGESEERKVPWQVPYILLLWLSHLLLTPFDLNSVSAERLSTQNHDQEHAGLPPLANRILQVGLAYLYSPTKAQDAAAAMLCRLCRRPDVQRFHLADSLARKLLVNVKQMATDSVSSVYDLLGSLRFVAGVTASAELSHLVPGVFRACIEAFDGKSLASNSSSAVAKKIAIKILRNTALLSLRSAANNGPLLLFLQTTGVLEDVIDFPLRSVGDKDTPVRFAAAKAISLIVAELEADMGHEIIQAVLDMFREDMPTSVTTVEFTTANPLKWHGLTLTLAQCLFKRSPSPTQLPDILNALILALQFHQRTATGTVLGSNVRDAANFGVWSLTRRYTTAELASVPSTTLPTPQHDSQTKMAIPQFLAIELILSACLDPVGNIRRGSSAALQELVGRHPDQVHEGIALVQIVEFIAVGLRNRAMIVVANRAASLHQMYWSALLDGLLGWRGIGSADAPSRQGAADSIAKLSVSRSTLQGEYVLTRVVGELRSCSLSNVELLHGYILTLACIMTEMGRTSHFLETTITPMLPQLWGLLEQQQNTLTSFSPRLLRSELPASLALYMTALSEASCRIVSQAICDTDPSYISTDCLDTLTSQLLLRYEDWVLTTIPGLVRSLSRLKSLFGVPLACVEPKVLAGNANIDASKTTTLGAAGAIALGSLLPIYSVDEVDNESSLMGIAGLESLISCNNVDWRVFGARALQLAVENASTSGRFQKNFVDGICSAVRRGLNDYTIDERGDVGSLVRLQCISCTSTILSAGAFKVSSECLQYLKADIYRLSLEKLDRVRLQAAICRQQHLGLDTEVLDVASVSSRGFFEAALAPLVDPSSPSWVRDALLQGCIACAGTGAEPVLLASRHTLVSLLATLEHERLVDFMSAYSAILKASILSSTNGGINPHAALGLLALLLDMQIPQRMLITSTPPTFKWLTLLSHVQKAHYKSGDLPRLLAAVDVYRGLADVSALRVPVLKKLVGMLRANPFPRARIAVADTLWMITKEEKLQRGDFGARRGADEELEKVLEGLLGAEHG